MMDPGTLPDVVFVSDACPSCHVVTDAVARSGLVAAGRLVVANIDRDPAARRYLVSLGILQVPTASIGGRAVTGAYNIIAALRARYGAVL